LQEVIQTVLAYADGLAEKIGRAVTAPQDAMLVLTAGAQRLKRLLVSIPAIGF